MTIWNKTTEREYWEMLGILPPAAMRAGGFLVGEAMDHRTCSVTGEIAARFSAFKEGPTNSFWKAAAPMTVAEFYREIVR